MSRSASALASGKQAAGDAGPVVVVGDSFLDRDVDGTVERVAPDAPVPVVRSPALRTRPGGAALAAALLARSGRRVVLVSALADDEGGATLARLLDRAGVEVAALALHGPTPEKVRVHGNGRPIVRLDHADVPSPVGRLTDAARRAIAGAAAVLVSDYGKGLTGAPGVREALSGDLSRRLTVWDPHPLGAEPVPGARVVTPNLAEANRLAPGDRQDLPAVTARAVALCRRWRSGGVAITLGERGALLAMPGAHPLVAPAPERVAAGTDTCGAGDRFAGEVAAALAEGRLLSEAVLAAVAAASSFVAGGGVGSLDLDPVAVPPPPELDAERLVRRVRAAGGTVVATGGCFDLLHAGHVGLLQAARALGDCLVVCINSDASVRRRKGSGRPVVAEADRAAVLRALDAVDAVAVFDEDTPERLLSLIRPDVWVKGADYAVSDLPEARTVAEWGGQAIVLPYLAGRSTTRLIEDIQRSAPPVVGGRRRPELEANGGSR